MELIYLIGIWLAGSLGVFFIDDINRKWTGPSAWLVSAVATVYLFFIPHGTSFRYRILDFNLHWQWDEVSKFFVWIISGLTLLALAFSIKYMEGKARQGYYYASFLMAVAGMTGVALSKDFLSLFIFWEIMTWTSFLLAIYNAYYGIETRGIKYMIFSAAGAYAMLTAIVFMQRYYGTLEIGTLWESGAFSFRQYAFIPVLLLFGFAVKAAVMPFHVWAPDVYAKTPMSFTAIFSGAMSKMGILGMLWVLAAFFLQASPEAVKYMHFVLGWAGAITAALATVYALRQDDAKYLLAWSSVAQLGYIVAALSTGTRLGLMAALFLSVLHASFKGSLFLVAGAVEKQAGTTDMRKISGLISRMPITFVIALISVISLAGVPPMGGFVGKWLLYESLITESGSYFLVAVIFFSSTAAFLYAYRFLYGLFLGQVEENIDHVREVSPLMWFPMLLLTSVNVITGLYPGVVFRPASALLKRMGLPAGNWRMSYLENGFGDGINVLHIAGTIGLLFIAVALFITLKGRKTTRFVSTKDISTSGEIPDKTDNLNFQRGFYKPFERAASWLYKYSMNDIWEQLGNGLEAFFGFVRKVYTGNGQTYALYVIVFLILLLLLKNNIF
jgi:NADH-quinone oxidoreductase subunit M